MRILLVADVSIQRIHGGAERVLHAHATGLRRRGHEVLLVNRKADDRDPDSTTVEGIPVRQYGVWRGNPIGYFISSIFHARRCLANLAHEEGWDLIDVYQPLSGFAAAHSAKARGTPVIYTFLSPAPLELSIRAGSRARHPATRVAAAMLRRIEGAALARAERIVALSAYSRSLLTSLYGTPPEKVAIIPGGIDGARFHPPPDRRAVRRRLGVPEGVALLLTVRNLEHRMGLEALIEAMPPVIREHPATLLLIGGEGLLRPALEQRIASLGLDKHVRLTGYIPEVDLPSYYQAADFFILPTRALEGFGLVTVEALACGTPVLGTPVGATPEILNAIDGRLLFEGPEPGPMAAGIGRWLRDWGTEPGAYAALRARCRQLAEARYTWERAVEALEAELAHIARARVVRARAPACAVCGGRDHGPAFTAQGLDYARCRSCNLIVASPLPTEEDLARYYRAEYGDRFCSERLDGARANVFAAILSRMGTLRPPGRLLDLGAGGGLFVHLARRAGWDATGIEISTQGRELARRRFGLELRPDWFTPGLFPEAHFDAVALINVLDHLRDPPRDLEEVHRILKPNGLIALRVPNGVFHAGLIRLQKSMPRLGGSLDLEARLVFHLYVFTPATLRALLQAAGFEGIRVRNSALTAGDPPAAVPEPAWARRILKLGVAAGAGVVSAASGGRWLLAPSIEAYAVKRRPTDEGRG